MLQKFMQLSENRKSTRTGKDLNVAEQLEEITFFDKDLKLVNLIPLPLSRIGGIDYAYIAVFDVEMED